LFGLEQARIGDRDAHIGGKRLQQPLVVVVESPGFILHQRDEAENFALINDGDTQPGLHRFLRIILFSLVHQNGAKFFCFFKRVEVQRLTRQDDF